MWTPDVEPDLGEDLYEKGFLTFDELVEICPPERLAFFTEGPEISTLVVDAYMGGLITSEVPVYSIFTRRVPFLAQLGLLDEGRLREAILGTKFSALEGLHRHATAWALVSRVIVEALGSDATAWEVAVKMAAAWPGTVRELVDSAHAVTR